MDFKSYLNSNARFINKQLDKSLSMFLTETKKLSPKILPLALEFVDSCKGGKTIRGVLCKMGYEIAMSLKGSWTSQDDIIKVGAGLEIMHAAILVHDDIIDQSPTRRGKPSLFKRVGKFQALALGDLGFFLAIKIISQSNFPQKEKNNALSLLSETMFKTAAGQIMDIAKDDPIKTARLKTALYTISGPLRLGAILAGATTSLLEKLDRFGTNLGIAYQIRDDILDGEAGDRERKQLREYTELAEKIIPNITSNVRIRKLLKDLCQYLLERTK